MDDRIMKKRTEKGRKKRLKYYLEFCQIDLNICLKKYDVSKVVNKIL